MPDQEYDIKYSGWAPCAHEEAEEATARNWLAEVTAGIRIPSSPLADSLIEGLIWAINDLGGVPTLASDQWVRVYTEGTIYKWTVHTSIEADYFLLGLAETYRWWKEKKQELASA